jgi:hypothetical protein
METLAFRPGRKCRSLQWLLGKDKIATCRVSQLCGGIFSRYGFKAAHLKLVRATASRLQTGMVRRVSGHTLSTVRGIERRIWESPSFMAWEDVKAPVSVRTARRTRPFTAAAWRFPAFSRNKIIDEDRFRLIHFGECVFNHSVKAPRPVPEKSVKTPSTPKSKYARYSARGSPA